MNYGNGFQTEAGRWFWFDATASRPWSRSHSNVRMAATINGLDYAAPFRYDAYTAQLWPSIVKRTSAVSLTLTPQLTAGGWKADSVSGAITVLGASAAAAWNVSGSALTLGGEVQHTVNGALTGTFGGVSLDAVTRLSGIDMGAGARSWSTPLGHEWGYSAFASRRIAAWARVDLQLARSVRDPVLATPGSLGASFGISWRIASQPAKAVRPVAAVGVRAPEGRKVRFTIEPPGATTVAVSGSFTDWNPIEMQRNGKTFSIELLVPHGTHQYGFLINGQTWYLPADASGVVDDGFGRKNATLVVD